MKICYELSKKFNIWALLLVCFGFPIVHSAQPQKGGAAAISSYGNFKLVYSVKAETIPVHKYESTKTGLKVVINEVEGPTVDGTFVVVTEAFDDDGLPHTLEHLIFLGSDKYPYKGFLDLLANRCAASGTNAWTATDHTAYTLTTAGSEGFLTMLPIYLDHILFATLKDSAFKTEVHHITEKGEDGGVVYSEMEGRENSSDSRSNRALYDAIYPGQCPFKSETGGLLKNLRESTTNEKIKKYHEQFYRAENLTLIISGEIKPEDIFKALQSVEDKILARKPTTPFATPFKEPCPPLTKSVDTEILFPKDTEDNGSVQIGWRGPTGKEYETTYALTVLLDYLTSTSISPLTKQFVEIKDPLARSVSYSSSEYSDTLLTLIFYGVPIAKLAEIKPKLMPILSKIADGTEAIDMKRMATLIHKTELNVLGRLENGAHSTISSNIIYAMIYGLTKEEFDIRLDDVTILNKLKTKDVAYWKNLVKKYLVETPNVTIRAAPSTKEQKRLQDEKAARINQRKTSLGEAGLAQKKKELTDAVNANEVEPPREEFTKIPVPKLDVLHDHFIEEYYSDNTKQHPKFDTRKAPFYMQIAHAHSKFIYVMIPLDTSQLTPKEQSYLPLLINLLTESPIKRGGKIIPHEQVVSEFENDFLGVGASLGYNGGGFFCGSFCHAAFLSAKIEHDKYEIAVTHLHEILYQTQITKERIKTITEQLIGQIIDLKADGSSVLTSVTDDMLYNEKSNTHAISMLRQHKFLKGVLASIDKPEGGKIVTDLTHVLKSITNPEKMSVHLSCDFDVLTSKYKTAAEVWNKLLPQGAKASEKKLKFIPDYDYMKPLETGEDKSCIVGVGSVQSSYLSQVGPGIKVYRDKDLAPLEVALNYMTQTEGPFWKKIRGNGFAYGSSFNPYINEGTMYLNLNRATNVINGFKESQTILKNLIGTDKWDEILFDSAKSSLIYRIVAREASVGGVMGQSQQSFFKNLDSQYNRNLRKEIAAVKLVDLKPISTKYLTPFVELQKSKLAIVADPAEVDRIATAFSGMGKKLQVFKSVDASFLNK